jgi:His-Xaa-Ser system radical SAM maturase HxsC
MLLSKIRSINHNINQEILFVFSEKEKCKAYSLNNSFNALGVIVSTTPYINSGLYIALSVKDLSRLSEGDIILFRPNGYLKILYKSDSLDNCLFVTEQCNNKCLMCSQPPRLNDDFDYYFKLNSKLIELLPQELETLGITGGEPTLIGIKLIELLKIIKFHLQNTSIQLLSNGRNFANLDYTKRISEINLPNLLFGIPFHSDFYKDHDYIAQSVGAYSETLKGLYNLARMDQNIELRIVVNKINYKRLFQISEYIFKNLSFVSHIAFMALEYTGYVPKNNEKIWVDPVIYGNELEKAVLNLKSWGMNVSIFNLPLCLTNKPLYNFVKKSISDWKIHYFEQCNNCILKEDCGGDFGTSLRHSNNISAIT